MYFLTAMIDTDGEQTLLRLDVDYTEAHKVMSYELTDSNGTRHEWSDEYRFEGTWLAFAISAMFNYIEAIITNGWTGVFTPIHAAVGIDLDHINSLLGQHSYLYRVEKPQELRLQ
jgi:hypothetical protein